jgi:hypothetical protein
MQKDISSWNICTILFTVFPMLFSSWPTFLNHTEKPEWQHCSGSQFKFFIYHQISFMLFCGTIVYVNFNSSCWTWRQPYSGPFERPRWQNFPIALGGSLASGFESIRTHPTAPIRALVSIS